MATDIPMKEKLFCRIASFFMFATYIPKNASRRRSVIGWIYCKGGRTMSTKWTFVR